MPRTIQSRNRQGRLATAAPSNGSTKGEQSSTST